MRPALLFLTLLAAGSSALAAEPLLLLDGNTPTTEAPHGKGNVYAPDIVRQGDRWLMFYGGQGRDGHDRIHLATSADGDKWTAEGVVFAPEGVNHVNDPSVVIVGEKFHMYYTRAKVGVTDTIALATSDDGQRWKDHGTILAPRDPPAWDSLLVGRPSVLYDGERFRMWFDGRADLPLGAPDAAAPQSADSRRYVGYAESVDGVYWQRRDEYVLPDAGGVHVSLVEGRYVMVIESREGTKWATSRDGLAWHPRGLLARRDDRTAPHGHVTPFLHATPKGHQLYFGAARSRRWDENVMMRVEVEVLRERDK